MQSMMRVPGGLFLLVLLHIFTGSCSGTLVTSCSSCHDEATCLESRGRGDTFSHQTLSCVCKEGFVGDGLSCYDTKQDCGNFPCCSQGYYWKSGWGCVEDPSVKVSCGGVVCPSGTDCISFNGTERCADPCEHYSIVNDEWRSVNYTRSGPYNSDHDVSWEGWYRMFLGQSNARIPDWCVSRFSCGTLNSLWMAQPHPTEYGRIFSSEVYCMYPSNCYDQRSYNIHVKLCYGNYYVYKLQNPNVGPGAYCAETYEANPGVPPTTDPRPQNSTTLATPHNSTVLPGLPTTQTPQPTPGNNTAVEGEIRLANGGNSSCSGRVEIFHNGQWGTVCDDSWDLNDAQVVCRQLGCGEAHAAIFNAGFGQGSGPIWLDDVQCFGNESSITDCTHRGFGVHNCGHHEDASAVCEFQSPSNEASQLICRSDKLLIGLHINSVTAAGLNPFSGNLASHNCSWFSLQDDMVWYEVDARAGACGNELRTNRTHAVYSNALFIYPYNQSFAVPVTLPFSCAYPLNTDSSLYMTIRPFLPIAGGISGDGPKARASMNLYRDPGFTDRYSGIQVSLPVGSPLYVGVTVPYGDTNFGLVLEDCFATHSSNPDDPSRYPLIQNQCPAAGQAVSIIESGRSLQARFSALLFALQDDYVDIFLHCNLSLCDRRRYSCIPRCRSRTSRSVSSSASVEPITIGPITWHKPAQ